MKPNKLVVYVDSDLEDDSEEYDLRRLPPPGQRAFAATPRRRPPPQNTAAASTQLSPAEEERINEDVIDSLNTAFSQNTPLYMTDDVAALTLPVPVLVSDSGWQALLADEICESANALALSELYDTPARQPGSGPSVRSAGSGGRSGNVTSTPNTDSAKRRLDLKTPGPPAAAGEAPFRAGEAKSPLGGEAPFRAGGSHQTRPFLQNSSDAFDVFTPARISPTQRQRDDDEEDDSDFRSPAPVVLSLIHI